MVLRTRRAFRLPAGLAVVALLGACSEPSDGRDAGIDAARDTGSEMMCDGTPPDGRVCETVCYAEGPTSLIPTPCERFCIEPNVPGGVGACYLPTGEPDTNCILESLPDSPDLVLC